MSQAILDLRLARLTKLEIFNLEQELKELKKTIKRLSAISKSGELQLQVVKEEITEIKGKYGTPRKSRLVFTREEADGLVNAAPVKKVAQACTFVYTADDQVKVLTGKAVDALSVPHTDKYKPQLLALHAIPAKTDKRMFLFTNYGNCHRLDLSDESL